MDELKLGTPSGKWVQDREASSDVVISSRVRLARNLASHPFPQWAHPDDLQAVGSAVGVALSSSKMLSGYGFHALENLSPLERQRLVEEHVISPEFAGLEKGYFLALSQDQKVALMVNEEDHLRIQALYPGFRVAAAWETASRVDDEVGKELEYAFSEKWGYLTACPTNTGTAMRVSIMLHLPALMMTKQLPQLWGALTQLGVVVRGLFGEGTHAAGNLFQVSNNTTLGRTEEEIVAHLTNVGMQIVERERTARKILYGEAKDKLADRAYRAVGILKYAKMMSFAEAIELLSMVRLGVDLGLVTDIDGATINELAFLIRPACLEMQAGRAIGEEKEEAVRSKVIQAKLAQVRGGEQGV